MCCPRTRLRGGHRRLQGEAGQLVPVWEPTLPRNGSDRQQIRVQRHLRGDIEVSCHCAYCKTVFRQSTTAMLAGWYVCNRVGSIPLFQKLFGLHHDSSSLGYFMSQALQLMTPSISV